MQPLRQTAQATASLNLTFFHILAHQISNIDLLEIIMTANQKGVDKIFAIFWSSAIILFI